MNLAKFDLFVTEVLTSLLIGKHSNAINFYRYFDQAWFNDTKEVVGDAQVLKRCAAVQEFGISLKYGAEVYFFVKEIDAAVAVQFKKPPRQTTIKKINEEILTAFADAETKYKATRHSLTGLINKDELHSILRSSIEKRSSDAALSQDIGSIATVTALTLIAIDIDFFKQINDSYGHPYGDIVLKCVALRLDKIEKELSSKFGSKCRYVSAHPSGEEFFVVAIGGISIDEEIEIAESIRLTIGGSALPSDTEMLRFSQSSSQEKLLPDNERKATVSVGIVNLASLPPDKDKTSSELVIALLDNADVALYRAKAAGRNCVVHFSHILEKFGRVIEHHEGANVVIVDIGRSVRVQEGQEFKVFHPDFYGGKPFIYRDGRTERRLGTYPKVQIGRVEVFEVQREISFCLIGNNKTGKAFPSGAILEAIPLGSITHLVDKDGRLLEADELDKEIKRIVDAKKMPFVCIYAIHGVDDLLAKKGMAYVNATLADIYSTLERSVRWSSAIYQIEKFKFAVLGRINPDQYEEKFNQCGKILDEVSDQYNGDMRIVAAFSPSGGFNSEHYFEYAHITAQNLVGQSISENFKQSARFSVEIALRVLSQHRAKQQYDQIIADYDRFAKLGIQSSYIENVRGIASYVRGDSAEAFQHFSKAIALEGENVGTKFKYNRALAAYGAGEYRTAYSDFEELFKADPNSVSTRVSVTSAALTYWEIFRMDRDANVAAKARKLIDQALVADQVDEFDRRRLAEASIGLSREGY